MNENSVKIDYLVKNEGWSLGVCGFRFGGMFGFLVPDSNIFKDLEYHLQGAAGDISSVEFQDYIGDQGAWLPVTYGETYESVIEKLSKKTPTEENLDLWIGKSKEAFNAVLEVIYTPYGLTAALEGNDQRLFYNVKV